MKNKIILQQIQQLELSLLAPFIRQSVEQLNLLLADDFLEFGSSGNAYNKQDIIKLLPLEEARTFRVSDFAVKELSNEVVLATYKTTENKLSALRASIWKYSNDRWQMVFHQGSKCEVVENESLDE